MFFYTNSHKVSKICIDDDDSIQFNSIYYLRAESTATRPITDTAQRRYNNNNSQTIMIIRIIIIVGQNNLLI
jgi:hypothetical protein